MIRLIYFTDPHIRLNNPKYRLDDYYSAAIKKLSCVATLGHRHDVDAYICGGDWVDRPDVPYSSLSGLAEVLTEFKKPIYTVLGNHDIYGYNPDTHNRTALSVLRASGLINRLSSDPILLEKEGTKVSLTGVDANPFIDKNGRLLDYTDVADNDGVKIHVVHGFLSKNPWPNVPVTLIDDIIDTNADIVLSGHEHSGFGVIEKNGKKFCNPGALLRVTASVGDVNLDVKIALITINGRDTSIELLRLPHDVVRPSNEVIDRKSLENEKRHKEVLTMFSESAKENISKVNLGSSFNIYELLDKLIESNDIGSNVEKIIRDSITKADEEIKNNNSEI